MKTEDVGITLPRQRWTPGARERGCRQSSSRHSRRSITSTIQVTTRRRFSRLLNAVGTCVRSELAMHRRTISRPHSIFAGEQHYIVLLLLHPLMNAAFTPD